MVMFSTSSKSFFLKQSVHSVLFFLTDMRFLAKLHNPFLKIYYVQQ